MTGQTKTGISIIKARQMALSQGIKDGKQFNSSGLTSWRILLGTNNKINIKICHREKKKCCFWWKIEPGSILNKLGKLVIGKTVFFMETLTCISQAPHLSWSIKSLAVVLCQRWYLLEKFKPLRKMENLNYSSLWEDYIWFKICRDFVMWQVLDENGKFPWRGGFFHT